MGNKLFSIALFCSLIIHVGVIAYLSIVKIKLFKKPMKQIEVTYQTVNQKKKKKKSGQVQNVKIIKQPKKEKAVKILTTKREPTNLFGQKIRDMTKLSDKISFGKKQIPKIKTIDIERKITVPVLKAEKITNPKYLSYNENIRHMIRQIAYRYVNHPDFQAGKVYLTFVLKANGELKDLKIIDSKTNANEYLRDIGLRSIKDSSPFPPFPEDLKLSRAYL